MLTEQGHVENKIMLSFMVALDNKTLARISQAESDLFFLKFRES